VCDFVLARPENVAKIHRHMGDRLVTLLCGPLQLRLLLVQVPQTRQLWVLYYISNEVFQTQFESIKTLWDAVCANMTQFRIWYLHELRVSKEFLKASSATGSRERKFSCTLTWWCEGTMSKRMKTCAHSLLIFESVNYPWSRVY
jgi:hypothetical protein